MHDQFRIAETLQKLRKEDTVNHPDHYNQGNLECIEAIEASMEGPQFTGFLKGQVIKYLWRFEHKENPKEDLLKAHFYLNSLIDHWGEDGELE